MKTLLLCALFYTACTTPAHAAERSRACEAYRASLRAQISRATSQGRLQEASEIRKSLDANKARCTDESVAAEREERIRKARLKLEDHLEARMAAERSGKADRIADRQKKLDAAYLELDEAMKPLPK
jgi:uncharacterized protein YdcH (DUF465 family)